jgi:hypothetical protein
MPDSMVRSDGVEPREGSESKAGSSSWVVQPRSWQQLPMLLRTTPSLFPNMAPEVLLFSQAQVKWDILCLSENDRS